MSRALEMGIPWISARAPGDGWSGVCFSRFWQDPNSAETVGSRFQQSLVCINRVFRIVGWHYAACEISTSTHTGRVRDQLKGNAILIGLMEMAITSKDTQVSNQAQLMVAANDAWGYPLK